MLFANGLLIHQLVVHLTHVGGNAYLLVMKYASSGMTTGQSGEYCKFVSLSLDLPSAPDPWDLEELREALTHFVGVHEYNHAGDIHDYSFSLRPGTQDHRIEWFEIVLAPSQHGVEIYLTEADEQDTTPWEFKCPVLAAALVEAMKRIMTLRPAYELTNATPGKDQIVHYRYTRIEEEAATQVA